MRKNSPLAFLNVSCSWFKISRLYIQTCILFTLCVCACQAFHVCLSAGRTWSRIVQQNRINIMSLIKDDLIKTVLLIQSVLGVAANGDEIQTEKTSCSDVQTTSAVASWCERAGASSLLWMSVFKAEDSQWQRCSFICEGSTVNRLVDQKLCLLAQLCLRLDSLEHLHHRWCCTDPAHAPSFHHSRVRPWDNWTSPVSLPSAQREPQTVLQQRFWSQVSHSLLQTAPACSHGNGPMRPTEPFTIRLGHYFP